MRLWWKGTITHTLASEDGFFLPVLFVAILFIFAVIGYRTQTRVHATVRHQGRGYVPREAGGLFDGGRYGATACSMRALNGERERID